MSLLMDALRRAEQEKKQQAEEAGSKTDDQASATAGTAEDEAPSGSGDLTAANMTQTTTVQSPYAGSEDVTMQIEPAEVERAEAAADSAVDEMTASMSGVIPPVDDIDDAPSPALQNLDQEDGDTSRALSLESDGDDSQMLDTSLVLDESVLANDDELSLEPIEGEDEALRVDDTSTHSMALPADLTGGTTVSSTERIDQTATMPSTRAVEQDLNAYFDQSQSMEMPRRGNTQAGDLTLEDVAAHTVVGAQTIFSAKERPRSRRLLVATTIIAIGVVVSIGVVGLFYAQRDPTPPPVPPPSVADGVERPPVRELPVVPLEPDTVSNNTEVARIETTIVGELTDADEASSAQTQIEQTASSAVDAAVVADATATPTQPLDDTAPEPVPAQAEESSNTTQDSTASALASSEPDAIDSAPPANAEDTIAAAPASTPSQSPAKSPAASANVGAANQSSLSDVGVGELRIARKRQPAAVDQDVANAYGAFKSGDFDTALKHYQTVIQRDETNRDARLGMGAIAVAKGDAATAYEHYRVVLKHHPKDATATAGILAISGGNDTDTAARLRELVDTYNDSPILRFALGNWYAQKQRWRDAQQAYFDAVRLDDSNADYAYNLAVSLDHLGLIAAAKDYYEKAITLSADGSAAFDPSAASSRLNTISASASP